VRLNTDYHENVNWAVEAFSNVRSEELFLRITCSDEHQAHIKATLVDKAGGTFLWISFAVTELMKQKTVSRVLDLLEDLPAGLSPYYGRMVQNIDAHERREDLRILGFVTYASRPLDLMELATLVGHVPRQGITPCENIKSLIAGYGPLLHVARQTELGPVSLVHESLRDYLNKGDFPAGVHMSAEGIHAHIARTCLNSLSSTDRSLLRFAEVFWPQHARASGKHAKELLSHPSSFFHDNHELRNKWWQTTLTPPGYYSAEYWAKRESGDFVCDLSPAVCHCYGTISRLHVACSIGFKPWVDNILENHDNWLSRRFYLLRRDSKGHTPIVHAVVEGHIEVVNALLEYTSAAKHLINATDSDKGALLHYAAKYDQLDVAKLLLLRHANVNTRNECGSTALSYAQNEAMIRLLIDHGANVKARCYNKQTALHLVYNEACARILIEHGAEVDSKNSFGCTPLLIQARDGDIAIFKLLLACGANAKSTDRLGHTALYLVTTYATGDEDTVETMVKLLLDNGADVNARWRHNLASALHNAAKEGFEGTAKILLDHGADVNGRNREKETALHCAATSRCEAVVRLLLDHGADVNGRNRNKQTALLLALDSSYLHKYSREGLIRLLLERGADVNAKCSFDKTAPQLAAREGNEAIMKILREYGADFNDREI
jgi:ankyrin repeat protein